MKIYYLNILVLILLMSVIFSPVRAGENDVAKPVKKTQKSSLKLFNGKNLDGWYTFLKGRGRNNDPNKVFTVVDGMIRVSGEEWGCITTNEAYENYKITVMFKWGEITHSPRKDNARDSGLLLHSVGEDGGSEGIWMHSIECQIIEGGTGDFIVVGDGSKDFSVTCPAAEVKQGGSYVFKPEGIPVTINQGRINWFGRDPGWKDIKGFRGTNDIEKPAGKWNRLECIVNGKEIRIYLNGSLVNHATDVKPPKGRIQLQSEGAEIFFRRIEISFL
ncbi:MAG TPA: DUF1080 domain-containing protein [Cyclobacteriaceae bacterium]|nr:DUF1080 domain-containing protein [Cyclobacteriaceae bacterium]